MEKEKKGRREGDDGEPLEEKGPDWREGAAAEQQRGCRCPRHSRALASGSRSCRQLRAGTGTGTGMGRGRCVALPAGPERPRTANQGPPQSPRAAAMESWRGVDKGGICPLPSWLPSSLAPLCRSGIARVLARAQGSNQGGATLPPGGDFPERQKHTEGLDKSSRPATGDGDAMMAASSC